jgi:hypothetical protein
MCGLRIEPKSARQHTRRQSTYSTRSEQTEETTIADSTRWPRGIDHLPANCSVEFVTASAEYAVHLFDVRACDCLLEPVEADRLAETPDRIRDAQFGHRSP